MVFSQEFQPTLPARGATQKHGFEYCVLLISTHAPRTGSDRTTTRTTRAIGTFQPTLPARGATPESALMALVDRLFQPTLPARGATASLP